MSTNHYKNIDTKMQCDIIITMNRILSLILSFMDELLPFFKPSNRKGFISVLFIVVANSIPIIGVVISGWNPYTLLLIYWGESLIIGIFNLLKMFISGLIDNGKFSMSDFNKTAGLCAFFIVHYGMFMLVHGIFIVIFMFLSLAKNAKSAGGSTAFLSAFSGFIPKNFTPTDILESEFSAIIALILSHFVSFYLYFIRTREYNYIKPENYMMRPYKRIVVMHLTIIFGAITLFISGFRSAVFIFVWIGFKILFDLKIHAGEINKSWFNIEIQSTGQKVV